MVNSWNPCSHFQQQQIPDFINKKADFSDVPLELQASIKVESLEKVIVTFTKIIYPYFNKSNLFHLLDYSLTSSRFMAFSPASPQ